MFGFVILCSFVIGLYGQSEFLWLNPTSTVQDDIKYIEHNQDQRLIKVEFQPYRRCRNPTLMVRMSGPSLYLLDRVNHFHEGINSKVERYVDLLPNRTNLHQFKYPPITERGVYYVEVLILVCTSFTADSYVGVCLEDVQKGRNVLNLPYSFEAKSRGGYRPRWVHEHINSSSFTSQLLPTRYQRHDCPNNIFCPQTDTSLHDMFEWTDGPDWRVPFRQLLMMNLNNVDGAGTPPIFICLVGASHSRFLRDYGTAVLEEDERKRIEFVFIMATHPEHFNFGAIASEMCTFVVLGFGQWTHSFTEQQRPFTNSKSKRELQRIISDSTLPVYNGSVQMFVRSMNYNGFGALTTVCPPLDYRQPHVVDFYNAMQKNVSAELGVGYIDLTHIMGPLWDSAADWNHPGARVYTAEAEHILYSVLTTSVKRQTQIVAVKTVATRMAVRFASANTVYLYQDGRLREFPDDASLLAMGITVSDVKVLPDHEMNHFGLGKPIPSA